jgi:hypothetical protein
MEGRQLPAIALQGNRVLMEQGRQDLE